MKPEPFERHRIIAIFTGHIHKEFLAQVLFYWEEDKLMFQHLEYTDGGREIDENFDFKVLLDGLAHQVCGGLAASSPMMRYQLALEKENAEAAKPRGQQ